MDLDQFNMDIIKLAHQGYCCSQMVMQLALDLQGSSNPGLIRSLSGLCHGVVATDGTCGTVTGAACMIAFYAGKGYPEEEPSELLPVMLSELADWFRDYGISRFGGINCSDIVRDNRPDTSVCGGLVLACFNKALAILMENGFDPASPVDD
jgi:hypothetical protein